MKLKFVDGSLSLFHLFSVTTMTKQTYNRRLSTNIQMIDERDLEREKI